MAVQRWDPMRELRELQQAMNRLWGREEPAQEGWLVPMDVLEQADRIIVRCTIPGVRPEDLEVMVEDNLLTVRGQTQAEQEERQANYLMQERRIGAFHRSLQLPDVVDTETATSRYENGVLTISFPKAESKRARRLQVQAGGD